MNDASDSPAADTAPTVTRVAQFRGSGRYPVQIMGTPDTEKYSPEFTRVTEWVEIEFVPLPPETLVVAEISSLDTRRAEVVAEFARKLKDIDDRKAELRAITHQGEPA